LRLRAGLFWPLEGSLLCECMAECCGALCRGMVCMLMC
jgi:hypothetical protein